jgi:hypothetical protein
VAEAQDQWALLLVLRLKAFVLMLAQLQDCPAHQLQAWRMLCWQLTPGTLAKLRQCCRQLRKKWRQQWLLQQRLLLPCWRQRQRQRCRARVLLLPQAEVCWGPTGRQQAEASL